MTPTGSSSPSGARSRAGPRARRAARRLGAALALAAGAAGGADAQTAAQPAPAAQTVALRLQPRTGDTLRMRLQQQVEMTGTMRVAGVDSTTTVVTTLRALTHAVVEQSDERGAVLVSTTDSVDVTSTGGKAERQAAALAARARAALQGRKVRLRVAPDGSTAVLSETTLAPELKAFLSQMPATLPRDPVAVGSSWTRTMDMPAAARRYPARGTVTAKFRFDSLARDGSLAFLSMRGTFTRADGAQATSGATRVAGTGALLGTIVIDRRRGWLAEARTTLTVRSTLTPSPSSGASPMQFRMRVNEWLRAVEK